MPAPVAIFVYNRPDHFRQVIGFLQKNNGASETDLYIFSDGARTGRDKEAVDAIRDFSGHIKGFRDVQVFSSEQNLGLKASVRKGISHVLSLHDSVIVVEDDICTNRNFLDYHNDCLGKYKDQAHVWSVSGYVIPAMGKAVKEQTGETYFLIPRASSWGWSTWKDRWEKVNWDEHSLLKHLGEGDTYKRYFATGGDKIRMLLDCFEKKNNSWAIIWDFNHFLNGGYCLYPTRSFVRNIGLDRSGVHSKPREEYAVELEDWPFDPSALPEKPVSPPLAQKIYRRLNRKIYRDILDRWRFGNLKLKF